MMAINIPIHLAHTYTLMPSFSMVINLGCHTLIPQLTTTHMYFEWSVRFE